MSERELTLRSATTVRYLGALSSVRNRQRRGVGAAALGAGIKVGVAVGLIAATALMGSSQAHAISWSDVSGAAKSVGKGVVDNAKDLGGAIKRDGKKIGGHIKNAGKGAVQNAKDLGSAIKRDSKKIGGHVKDGVSAAYDHNVIRSAIAPGFFVTPHLTTGICGLDNIGDNIGKYDCRYESPQVKPSPNVPSTGPGSWGGPPRNPGNFSGSSRATVRKAARPGLAGRTNEVVPIRRSKRRNEVVPIKRGGRRNEVVPIRRSGKRPPVQGIRKENLKPGGGRETRENIARDRTVWGRPVGVMRPKAPSRLKVRRVIRDHRPANRATKRIVRDHRKAPRPGRAVRRDNRASSRNAVRPPRRMQGRAVHKPRALTGQRPSGNRKSRRRNRS